MSDFNKVERLIPENSFVHDYLRMWPTAEPPRSFLVASALCMLGAALGRKVWFDQDVHILYPMLNLLLIGPSGIGKSTSIMLAKDLVDRVPREEQPQFFKGMATTEKLHDDLQVLPHAILFCSELANFFGRQKYLEGLIPYITEVLDYPQTIERRTKAGHVVTVAQPAVTVVGGSTVQWLQEQLPDSATSGGFLARFLIVAEGHKGQRVALQRDAISEAKMKEVQALRYKVHDRFYQCLHVHQGRVEFWDFGSKDIYSEWYDTHESVTGHLSPFAARGGEFILRLAILIALSCGRGFIKEVDMEAAIALYTYSESCLQGVVVPFSPAGKLLAQVLAAIPEQGTNDVGIKKTMRNYCTSQDVDKLLQSLLFSKDIKLVEGKYFRVNG